MGPEKRRINVRITIRLLKWGQIRSEPAWAGLVQAGKEIIKPLQTLVGLTCDDYLKRVLDELPTRNPGLHVWLFRKNYVVAFLLCTA
jgi:hypothetical protein